jgi:hypothetical protein
MLSYADVEKLLAAGSEDPPVLSLYLEMPRHLPQLREVPDRARQLLDAATHGMEGRRAADVRPDGRPGGGTVVQPAARARHRPGRRHRLGHRVGRHRRLLPQQLATRILRRRHRRRVLPHRPGLGRRTPARVCTPGGARTQPCPLIPNDK